MGIQITQLLQVVCTLLYCTALHCTVLYCIVLHYIVLEYLIECQPNKALYTPVNHGDQHNEHNLSLLYNGITIIRINIIILLIDLASFSFNLKTKNTTHSLNSNIIEVRQDSCFT